MTSSDKPQESESRSTGEQETTSTTTTAEATTSVSEGMSTDAAESGGDSHGSAGGAKGSRSEADGSGGTPPWQRVGGSMSTSAASADTSSGAAEVSDDSDGHRDADSGAGYEEEETHRIPHPAGSASQSAGSQSAGSQSAGDSTGDGAAESARAGISLGMGGGARGGAATQGAPRRPSRGPRRASLQIRRVDPWSVLKLALMLSVTLFFVWLIAVAVLYGVLGGMGVWEQLNGTFSELTQPENSLSQPLISPVRVFAVASMIGAVNIVLFTALATVAGFIYNVAADFVGGVEVTLSERE